MEKVFLQVDVGNRTQVIYSKYIKIRSYRSIQLLIEALKLIEIVMFRTCSVNYCSLNVYLHMTSKDKKEEWRHRDMKLKEVIKE